MDVTREPRIAGFFASHTSSPPAGPVESCILCFHSQRFREAMESLRRKMATAGFDEDDISLPDLIEIDVDNLWRLQAQFGAFLHVPWPIEKPDERLIEHMLDATCLVFPFSSRADVPERLVYPDRKSALEILLDEFFAREALAVRHEELRAHGVTVLDAATAQEIGGATDFAALGFRPEVVELLELQRDNRNAEIFLDGEVPEPHPSWQDPELLLPWLKPAVEPFHGTYSEHVCTLSVESASDLQSLEERCVASVAELLQSGELSRERSVGWRILDPEGAEVKAPGHAASLDPAEIDGEPVDDTRATAGRWADLAWDGLRALPYTDEEISVALGRTIAGLAWLARGGGPVSADRIRQQLALELITSTEGDPVATIDEEVFRFALRHDLPLLLDPRWQDLAGDPGRLLMVLGIPALMFDFERWKRVFAVYLVPSQILGCAGAGGEWVIYNPLLVQGLRAH